MTNTAITATFPLKCVSVEFLIWPLGKSAALATANLFTKPNVSMCTEFDPELEECKDTQILQKL